MSGIDRDLIDIAAPAADKDDRERDHEAGELENGFERGPNDSPPRRIRRTVGTVGVAPAEMWRVTRQIVHANLRWENVVDGRHCSGAVRISLAASSESRATRTAVIYCD